MGVPEDWKLRWPQTAKSVPSFTRQTINGPNQTLNHRADTLARTKRVSRNSAPNSTVTLITMVGLADLQDLLETSDPIWPDDQQLRELGYKTLIYLVVLAIAGAISLIHWLIAEAAQGLFFAFLALITGVAAYFWWPKRKPTLDRRIDKAYAQILRGLRRIQREQGFRFQEDPELVPAAEAAHNRRRVAAALEAPFWKSAQPDVRKLKKAIRVQAEAAFRRIFVLSMVAEELQVPGKEARAVVRAERAALKSLALKAEELAACPLPGHAPAAQDVVKGISAYEDARKELEQLLGQSRPLPAMSKATAPNADLTARLLRSLEPLPKPAARPLSDRHGVEALEKIIESRLQRQGARDTWYWDVLRIAIGLSVLMLATVALGGVLWLTLELGFGTGGNCIFFSVGLILFLSVVTYRDWCKSTKRRPFWQRRKPSFNKLIESAYREAFAGIVRAHADNTLKDHLGNNFQQVTEAAANRLRVDQALKGWTSGGSNGKKLRDRLASNADLAFRRVVALAMTRPGDFELSGDMAEGIVRKENAWLSKLASQTEKFERSFNTESSVDSANTPSEIADARSELERFLKQPSLTEDAEVRAS